MLRRDPDSGIHRRRNIGTSLQNIPERNQRCSDSRHGFAQRVKEQRRGYRISQKWSEVMRTRPDPPGKFFRGDARPRHVLANPPGDNTPQRLYAVAAETLRLEELIEGRPPVAEIPELRT
jgi:hypothetical protein